MRGGGQKAAGRKLAKGGRNKNWEGRKAALVEKLELWPRKCPEALSTVTLKNALRLYAQNDLYQLNSTGRLEVERDRLKAWGNEMKAWLE